MSYDIGYMDIFRLVLGTSSGDNLQWNLCAPVFTWCHNLFAAICKYDVHGVEFAAYFSSFVASSKFSGSVGTCRSRLIICSLVMKVLFLQYIY
jgi:hypothetical protein